MSARAMMGVDFNTGAGFDPITKTDGLLYFSGGGQILVWYNGAWRSIIAGGSIDPFDPAPDGNPLTPVPTPPDAAIAFCGPEIGSGAGPQQSATIPAPPYTNGQLWYNTTAGRMRLEAWNNTGWTPIQ
jgi:hypothetical protein